jgi:hypothetical protein
MGIQDNTEETKRRIVVGGCVCGAVRYQVVNLFSRFLLCHCQQCQKLTGSAFAANIFTSPENIQWLSGYENISFYEHQSRDFSKAFCVTCGSALPFVNRSGKSLIIPAGSLSDKIEKKPDANIFLNEQANWLSAGLAATNFDRFPE